jgi:hypothetical protein
MPGQGLKTTSLVIEQLGVMLSQEKTTYEFCDYLNLKDTAVCAADREILCTWGLSVVDACSGVDKSAVAVAVSYFDRYLSLSEPSAEQALNDRFQFQLAFVACLVIALKAHSGFNVEVDFISDVVCDGSYKVEEIIGMENEILRSLQWRLNGPTPHDFIDGFLQVVPALKSQQVEFLSRYSKHIASVGITSYFVALHCPSTIAYASISCALQYMDAVSPVDGVSILQYLNMIPGATDGSRLQMLVRTMLSLVRCSEDGRDYASVTSEASPVSVMRTA